MIRTKNLWMVLGLVACLSVAASATAVAPWINMYVAGNTGVWLFNNTAGMDVTGIQIEFDQQVTIVNKVEFGGAFVPMGPLTGTAFTLVGSLVNGGALELDWQPANAVPTFAIWLSGAQGVGQPFFTTLAKLGYLFGQGIVHMRETDPAALNAAFAQFFADNAAYLAGLSESLGMSLADSLMPIIMASPAEGIENFFNTIMGMLGVTELSEVVAGAVDFGALFELLGM
jgi:hypothetical protein